VSGGDPEIDLETTRAGLAFWIAVTPRARREQVGGCHGGALRVAVREPPVEGAATAACARALARALGVRSAAVQLAPNARGRRKRVVIEAADRVALTERLRALAREAPSARSGPRRRREIGEDRGR
jgi:uncharacterized protein YggU (UPF0235/DUF167 family)